MSWWKRIVFLIISTGVGFCSLDYLYYAFGLLVNANNTSGEYQFGRDIFMQLLGALLFLVWFAVIAGYAYFIRRNASRIDILKTSGKRKKQRIRSKWFELILQGGFLFTGILLRWGYLLIIYFPNR